MTNGPSTTRGVITVEKDGWAQPGNTAQVGNLALLTTMLRREARGGGRTPSQ